MGPPSECEVDDVMNEVAVADTRRAARPGEPGVCGEVAVRVDVDDERRAVGVEAQVEAGVVAQLQGGERRG